MLGFIRQYRKDKRKKREKVHREAFKKHIQLMMAPMDPNVIDVAFRIEGEEEFREPPNNRLMAPSYWLSKNGVLHNQWCGWYKNCAGREVRTPEGKPCQLCQPFRVVNTE